MSRVITPSAKKDPKPNTSKSRLSRPAMVAEAIKSWVLDQALQPGDRLPSELELIERFGMAKSTIREALRILEGQGLIKTRTGPGGGAFIHEVSAERAKALLSNYFYFKNLTIADVYQLRRILEPELAESLAGELTEEQLQALEQSMCSYAEFAETIEEEKSQHVASLRFHALLAENSDNTLLGFLIHFMAEMLSDLTVQRHLYDPPNRELWERGKNYQAMLVKALRRGDKAEARRISSDHMETAQRLMQAQEAKMVKRFISE